MARQGYNYTANGKMYFVCFWCKCYEVVGHSTLSMNHQHEGVSYYLCPVSTKGEAVAMCKGRPKTKQTAKTHPTV